MFSPRFHVALAVPVYHAIYDGLVGHDFRLVESGSLKYAQASVKRRNYEFDRDQIDDAFYAVVTVSPDGRINRYMEAPVSPPSTAFDDMPF